MHTNTHQMRPNCVKALSSVYISSYRNYSCKCLINVLRPDSCGTLCGSLVMRDGSVSPIAVRTSPEMRINLCVQRRRVLRQFGRPPKSESFYQHISLSHLLPSSGQWPTTVFTSPVMVIRILTKYWYVFYTGGYVANGRCILRICTLRT